MFALLVGANLAAIPQADNQRCIGGVGLGDQLASPGFRGRLVCPRIPGKANYIPSHFGERLRFRRTHPEDGIFEKAILQFAGKNPVAMSHVHVEHTVTSVGPNNR
jgi:hypothetical protein